MFSHQLYIIYMFLFFLKTLPLQRTDGTSRCTSHLFFWPKKSLHRHPLCRKSPLGLTDMLPLQRPRSFKIPASLGTSFCWTKKSSGSSLGRLEMMMWNKYTAIISIGKKLINPICRGLYTHYKDSLLIGGGNSNDVWFSPRKLGEMIQFDEHMFQLGWFNHQLDTPPKVTNVPPPKKMTISKGKACLQPSFLKGYVSFRGVPDWSFSKCWKSISSQCHLLFFLCFKCEIYG